MESVESRDCCLQQDVPQLKKTRLPKVQTRPALELGPLVASLAHPWGTNPCPFGAQGIERALSDGSLTPSSPSTEKNPF